MFDRHGHLTETALRRLAAGEDMKEDHRLVAAEHLSCCDRCLQRYTALLMELPLETPAVSCRETIWGRIRRRTIRILTSRYATAAAAVALALTMLWADPPLPQQLPEPPRPLGWRMEEGLTVLSEPLNALLEQLKDEFPGHKDPGHGGNGK